MGEGNEGGDKSIRKQSHSGCVTLSVGKRLIGCKWIYNVKYKATDKIERFKARLIAKGYNQKEGTDYQETFLSAVKMVAIITILALAAANSGIYTNGYI